MAVNLRALSSPIRILIVWVCASAILPNWASRRLTLPWDYFPLARDSLTISNARRGHSYAYRALAEQNVTDTLGLVPLVWLTVCNVRLNIRSKATPSQPVKQTVSRYRVLRKIGGGAMAKLLRTHLRAEEK